MADAVQTFTIYPEPKVGTSTVQSRRQVMKFTNLSDGTGESGVTKIDISTLTGPNGVAPTKISIQKIQYHVQGMAIKVYFDRTTDIIIGQLNGFGCIDYTDVGGLVDIGTGDTGDVLFTTTGHSAGDTYDITIEFIKKY